MTLLVPLPRGSLGTWCWFNKILPEISHFIFFWVLWLHDRSALLSTTYGKAGTEVKGTNTATSAPTWLSYAHHLRHLDLRISDTGVLAFVGLQTVVDGLHAIHLDVLSLGSLKLATNLEHSRTEIVWKRISSCCYPTEKVLKILGNPFRLRWQQ